MHPCVLYGVFILSRCERKINTIHTPGKIKGREITPQNWRAVLQNCPGDRGWPSG